MSAKMVKSEERMELCPSSPTARMMGEHSNRVLIYTTCYNVIDGVTLTIRKIEQEILACGGHVCILTTKSGNLSNTHLDGEHRNRQVIFLDNSIEIPFLHDPNNPEASYHLGFSLSRSVKAQLEAFEPSVIHMTVPDCTAMHVIAYARQREIPLMCTYHSNIVDYMDHYQNMGWLKPILAAFFRHAYNFMQTLYVPTPFIRQNLIQQYKMDRVTNVRVWGRGIDLGKFSPAHRSIKYRRSLGISDDAVVVCFVGRLVPEKRPDIFAQVIRRLFKQNCKYHAIVVGAGPFQDEMATLPNTTCLGWLNSDDLPMVYASSDIFLFPSAVETFGNVTLEAAACGLPLVVEAGCSGHLVKHGINGYACSSDDADAYFNATLDLITHHNKRNSFSEQSRIVSQSFEKRAVVQQMLRNYASTIHEFYHKFGGHHQNRDAAFKNEDSFKAGTSPRPLAFCFFEHLFICAFQVIWVFLSTALWFQDFLQTRFPSPVPTTLMTKGDEACPPPEPLALTATTPLASGSMPALTEHDEDDTSSTSCFSRPPFVGFGDSEFAKNTSTAFVEMVMFSMRFTCGIAGFLRGISSRASLPTFQQKRKDSYYFTQSRVLSDFGIDSTSHISPHLERRRIRRNVPAQIV